MEKNHYVLSLQKENSGSFEHGWNLAKNLKKAGKNVEYYSHWWDSPVSKINLNDESSYEFNPEQLSGKEGFFHLQTHTWEYGGLLKKILTNENQKLIYNLHAIIPYFYMNEDQKKLFLRGELEYSKIGPEIESKMSEREKTQLSLFEKADYLFAISKNHKKVLDLMGIDASVHVFENMSDLGHVDEGAFSEAKELSDNFRNSLDADNVLLYCGRVEKSKGSFGLFNSFREIKKNFPSSKLILLGSGRKRLQKLESLGLAPDILPDIELIPWADKNTQEGRREFLKYYISSDVLVQPMITEELYSKTVIDAMSLGLPTITCKSPYTIGSSANAQEIFDSFVFMKKNPEEVQKLINLAKGKVKKENTWDSYISRLSDLSND